MSDTRIRRIIDELEPAARAEIFRVLTSTSDVRADVIRQFYEGPGGEVIGKLLIYLEEWEGARQVMIEELRGPRDG